MSVKQLKKFLPVFDHDEFIGIKKEHPAPARGGCNLMEYCGHQAGLVISRLVIFTQFQFRIAFGQFVKPLSRSVSAEMIIDDHSIKNRVQMRHPDINNVDLIAHHAGADHRTPVFRNVRRGNPADDFPELLFHENITLKFLRPRQAAAQI